MLVRQTICLTEEKLLAIKKTCRFWKTTHCFLDVRNLKKKTEIFPEINFGYFMKI